MKLKEIPNNKSNIKMIKLIHQKVLKIIKFNKNQQLKRKIIIKFYQKKENFQYKELNQNQLQ